MQLAAKKKADVPLDKEPLEFAVGFTGFYRVLENCYRAEIW